MNKNDQDIPKFLIEAVYSEDDTQLVKWLVRDNTRLTKDVILEADPNSENPVSQCRKVGNKILLLKFKNMGGELPDRDFELAMLQELLSFAFSVQQQTVTTFCEDMKRVCNDISKNMGGGMPPG